MNFAETISRAAYNRSSSVDDPKNANKDWRAGWAVGRTTDAEGIVVISREWLDRGKPDAREPAFAEWKMGFWAGRFTRLDDQCEAKSQP